MKRCWRNHKESIASVLVLSVIVGFWWCWGVALAPRLQARIQSDYEATQLANKKAANKAITKTHAEAGAEKDAVSTGDYFARLGQSGDLFGAVNALFASIAVAGVFWAGALQRRTMMEARQAIAQQKFETAFFELLKLNREVIELFHYTYSVSSSSKEGAPSERSKSGYAALNALTFRVFGGKLSGLDGLKNRQRLKFLVDLYKDKGYRAHPSSLGPYFRLLYQTFQLVAEAPMGEKEKIRYANIARGQMSEGAVLLLALNALTWRGQKFVDLIERFGLLEHMHPSYVVRFRADLLCAYRKKAFLGSLEREVEGDAPAPSPGPFAFDKKPSDQGFEVSKPFDDAVLDE